MALFKQWQRLQQQASHSEPAEVPEQQPPASIEMPFGEIEVNSAKATT
jgi:hypothetical protein